MRSTLEAPPNAPDPMLPGMGLLMVNKDLRRQEEAREEEPSEGGPAEAPARRRRPIRRLLGSRWLAWVLVPIVALSATGVAIVVVSDARGDVDRLAADLEVVRAQAAEDAAFVTASQGRNAALRARLVKLQAQVAELESAKVQTIVETETVTITETVTEYVPDGEAVTVEITGFDGIVHVYDVRLTHSYGYSDLIGIAENTSGEVISYAQLSCSFLAKDGELLATSIDNKQDWQPGQSWGFVCSADVDATGGILRVDEMS